MLQATPGQMQTLTTGAWWTSCGTMQSSATKLQVSAIKPGSEAQSKVLATLFKGHGVLLSSAISSGHVKPQSVAQSRLCCCADALLDNCNFSHIGPLLQGQAANGELTNTASAKVRWLLILVVLGHGNYCAWSMPAFLPVHVQEGGLNPAVSIVAEVPRGSLSLPGKPGPHQHLCEHHALCVLEHSCPAGLACLLFAWTQLSGEQLQ